VLRVVGTGVDIGVNEKVVGENVVGEKVVGENVVGENVVGEKVVGEKVVGENDVDENEGGMLFPSVVKIAGDCVDEKNGCNIVADEGTNDKLGTNVEDRANAEVGINGEGEGSVDGDNAKEVGMDDESIEGSDAATLILGS
jgi:hypothetical protein